LEITMRILATVLGLILVCPVLAAAPKVQRGLPYAEPKNERQMLDVYAPTEGKGHPVVLWIHGGGWKAGDKRNVQQKPQAFVDQGFILVSTNYRFVPNVTLKEMTGDIARAIRWIHDHATEFGGDPKSIFVMGHSAGAHLAALVCTDDRYLKAEGLSLSILKGCVPVDVSVYDIPKRLKESGSAPPATFKAVFGETEDLHRELSPATHVAKGKHIPPFLILHVADRPETKAQSHWLADKLTEAGVPARVVAAEGTTHGTINANLGKSGDRPTEEMWAFLSEAARTTSPEAGDMKIIFNGRDLTGWNGDPRLWSVKNGVLRGETTKEKPAKGNTFLIWKEGTLKDFDLRLSFRMNAANNSGIQYRSRHITEGKVNNPWVVRGYQHELRNEKRFPNTPSFIYDEGGKRGRMCQVGERVVWTADGKKALKEAFLTQAAFDKLMRLDDWNDVVILAKGKNIKHYLNGQLVVDFTDEEPRLAAPEGILALQLHAGVPMWVEFKNIRLKQLP
jgi:arylformamidase